MESLTYSAVLSIEQEEHRHQQTRRHFITFDSAYAIATKTAGAAGAGAMDNFDLYDRIRSTRHIDGASIPNFTRWK